MLRNWIRLSLHLPVPTPQLREYQVLSSSIYKDLLLRTIFRQVLTKLLCFLYTLAPKSEGSSAAKLDDKAYLEIFIDRIYDIFFFVSLNN